MTLPHAHMRGLWVCALLVAATACSTVGEKDFACPGRPLGVRCMSATEVYGATHDSDEVAATSPKALGSDPPKAPARAKGRRRLQDSEPKHQTHKSAPPSSEPPAETGLLRTQTLSPMVDKPIPIRTPAQVMRAWIAPWEDARGVLHAGGYAFIEVESRRWTFGETQTTAEPVRFFSIQRSAVEAKETVGKDRSVPAARAGTSERSERPNSSSLPKTGASK
jgi:conjugal transfer pilus assembly protein TraV